MVARADLTIYPIDSEGVAMVSVPVTVANGAMFANDGNTYVWLQNIEDHDVTATFTTPAEFAGLALGDRLLVVPHEDSPPPFPVWAIGPFETELFNQPTGDVGKVYINVDVEGLQVVAFRMG